MGRRNLGGTNTLAYYFQASDEETRFIALAFGRYDGKEC